MTNRGYFYHHAPDAYFARLDSLINRADVEPTRAGTFGKSDSLFEAFLALPTGANRDAPPAPGRFPLVMYSLGYNDRSQDNSVLAEYLASHGFVVASVPQVGTRSSRLTLRIHPADLETQARDIEFATGVLQRTGFIDRRKLALMGYSMGGVVGLLVSLRNPNVDAFVGLDPSFRAPRFVSLVTGAPTFDPRRLRIPLLSLQSGLASEATAQDSTVIDSLKFSERFVGMVQNAAHGDFSDFAMLAPLFPVDIQGRTAGQARPAHEAITVYVLRFLQASLNGDSGARAVLERSSRDLTDSTGVIKVRHLAGITVPTEEDLIAVAARWGFDRAVEALNRASQQYPDLTLVDQTTMNRLGYGLIEQGRQQAAVNAFRLNVTAHPASTDAYDSLAEGYLAAHDTARARAAYQRLLEVLPSDPSLAPAAREELRKATEEKLRSLRP